MDKYKTPIVPRSLPPYYDPPSPEDLAKLIHSTAQHLQSQYGYFGIGDWDKLSDDQKQIGIAVASEVRDELYKQIPWNG